MACSLPGVESPGYSLRPLTGPRRRARAWGALLPLLLAASATVLAGDAPDATTPVPAPLRGDAWTQWGGPGGDFQAPARGLATSWPAGGPETLWRRALGDGYSAILFEDGRLYTMYRAGVATPAPRPSDGSTIEEESVICLDAETGETVWEHRYERATFQGLRGYGTGPSSTGLIAGERLFTVGLTGKMHGLGKRDGKVLWSRELMSEDLGGNGPGRGYSSSPVAYEDTVIVPVGGENAGLVAVDQKTGGVRWRALSFSNSHSSPRIVEIAGEQQLVMFMAEELIGVDPGTGRLRWRYPHANQWRHNISVPLVVGGAGDMIFLSSPQAGARGLRLSRDGEAIRVEETWHTRRIQLYHASAVSSGDWVYGSSGVTSPAFMAAVNARTGEIGWRLRGFAKANVVAAGGKLVILDEDGVLYLATATPEELVVHAQSQLLGRYAWTVPTIAGKTLYARDRREIVALNLG